MTKVQNCSTHTGLAVYLAATGVKVGSKGKVHNVSNALGMMDKGNARKLRKTLRAEGRTAEAAAPRVVS